MNIQSLLKEKNIRLFFTQGINHSLKKELSQGEIITNDSHFSKLLLLKNGFKDFHLVKNASLKTVLSIEKRIRRRKIIGIGGGKALDVAKKVAFDLTLPLTSVPTAPSHDGLISKNSSLYTEDGKRITFPTTYPRKIFIPLSLWKKSRDLKKAGFCDILSNIIALQDISLAEKIKKEKFKKKYKILSERAVRLATLSNIHRLSLALLYSGFAMEETSRYCSGSEHDVERLLEKKMRNRFFHGQLAGTGALISAKIYSLYEKDLPLKLRFPSKNLFQRIYSRMKRNHTLEFALLPLKDKKFHSLWLQEVSQIRPERFNLWNVIDSRKIDWEKVISEITQK